MILVKTPAFIKSAKSIIKNNSVMANELSQTLNQLSMDPFNPQLKTHKLKGNLAGSYACRVNFEIRIVFQIVNEKNPKGENIEKILLEAVGTHDNVY